MKKFMTILRRVARIPGSFFLPVQEASWAVAVRPTRTSRFAHSHPALACSPLRLSPQTRVPQRSSLKPPTPARRRPQRPHPVHSDCREPLSSRSTPSRFPSAFRNQGVRAAEETRLRDGGTPSSKREPRRRRGEARRRRVVERRR